MRFLSTLPFSLAALLLAPLAATHAAGTPSKPNILFILCDDICWNAMSCAGHPTLRTPNIDRIAKERVRFANMFCTTSLCSPSRASILTGLYAHTHVASYPGPMSSSRRRHQTAWLMVTAALSGEDWRRLDEAVPPDQRRSCRVPADDSGIRKYPFRDNY